MVPGLQNGGVAMPKPKPRQKLVCIPCGREVVVSAAGVSRTSVWCCGKPMRPKTAAKTTRRTKRTKTTRRAKRARRM
jgi:hypothetical protein